MKVQFGLRLHVVEMQEILEGRDRMGGANALFAIRIGTPLHGICTSCIAYFLTTVTICDNGVRNDESPSLFHSFTPWEVQCRMPWHAIDAGGLCFFVCVRERRSCGARGGQAERPAAGALTGGRKRVSKL